VKGAGEKREIGSGQRALIHAAGRIYRHRRRAATILVVAAALGFGYNAVFGVNGINMFEHKRAEDRAIQQRILELKQTNQQLQQNVQELQSDPDAIEHEARERLHYARPGEVIWTENAAPQQPSAGSQP
jgi:cell division protein FtsB